MRLKNTGFALLHIVAVGNVRKYHQIFPRGNGMGLPQNRNDDAAAQADHQLDAPVQMGGEMEMVWKDLLQGVVHQNLLDAVR